MTDGFNPGWTAQAEVGAQTQILGELRAALADDGIPVDTIDVLDTGTLRLVYETRDKDAVDSVSEEIVQISGYCVGAYREAAWKPAGVEATVWDGSREERIEWWVAEGWMQAFVQGELGELDFLERVSGTISYPDRD